MNQIKVIAVENQTAEGCTLVFGSPVQKGGKGIESTKWWVSWEFIAESIFNIKKQEK